MTLSYVFLIIVDEMVVVSFLLIQGHENKYSIYVHASKKSPVHTSSYFVGRDIHSHKVNEIDYTIQSILYL